ncbi:hypothetical protein F8388_003128 [Cannabis sativa]|uniref:Ubiquitin-like protease family profile domain-containing protein n=1 Tax=Cannabis sativa TaxID=3483 RepID=A0A7J6HTG2_CANSA|nr:hypothetical protein F8388_003128 [Cannabis sativa]KAF4398594.1 hypothetical protein G4B88_013683 [Cannabis sativa]
MVASGGSHRQKNLRFILIECSDLMSIKVAPAYTVPLNKRTGCGIFMLKTMEMHIDGKCNESATMLLNDDNIDTFRKAYAVQLYVGSANP